MPRYLRTLGSALEIAEPMYAPPYLPMERARMYTMPASPTVARMEKSSSAPESTKNSMKSPGVQSSERLRILMESLRRFARNAPSIIQVSREESSQSSLSATHAKTAAIMRHSLFAFEWKNFIISASSAPVAAPTRSERPISRSGSSSTACTVSSPPTAKTCASAKHTEKMIRPTASSNAVTGRSVSVTGPRALY